MKNFKIHSKLKGVPFYAISRSNKAYDFFKTEYHNLPEVNGHIIVPGKEIEDRIVDKEETLPTRIKKRFASKDKVIYVGLGNEAHPYFKNEYGISYLDDETDGYYVPTETIKRR